MDIEAIRLEREEVRKRLKEQAAARRLAKAAKSKPKKKRRMPPGARKQISQEEVRRLFDYRDGKLYWRVKVWTNVAPGDRAGTVKKQGYRKITIGGQEYMEHRLVYQWHHDGPVPDYIDHINGVRDDNRIENLRASDQRLNQGNRKAQASSSRYKGVRWDWGGWRASITVNQREEPLGRYRSEEEAAEAYNRRAVEVFGDHALLNQILYKCTEREASSG